MYLNLGSLSPRSPAAPPARPAVLPACCLGWMVIVIMSRLSYPLRAQDNKETGAQQGDTSWKRTPFQVGVVIHGFQLPNPPNPVFFFFNLSEFPPHLDS